jgi:glutamine amidotransferase
MGTIAIVDYGVGNSGSIRNMFTRLGIEAQITSDPVAISQADRLILPGVGAFDNAMRNLASRGLTDVLTEVAVVKQKPVLGICLGMQIMTRSSEEGSLPGLGWIAARTRRFCFVQDKNPLRVPHMGWNVAMPRKIIPLWKGMEDCSRFYFVHSYHVCCETASDVATTTDYGGDFTSAFAHENLYGVQFHPEKSHRFGMALLRNFAEIS